MFRNDLFQRALSRRQFLRGSAGMAGLALGGTLLAPARAWAQRHVAPRPIPGGVTVVIGDERFPIHHFPVTGPVEPSEISDLDGHVGDCRILGTGLGINTDSGERTDLLFQADMGFMQGVYVGEDGHRHHGTFAFVWMDLYEGQVDLNHQIHDYNPGIPASGLFWVVRVPEDAVALHQRQGRAALHVTDLEVEDFGNLLHALRGDPSVAATVSFDIRWRDVIQPLDLHDEDNRFEGSFLQTHAFIEWSARQEGFEFLSDPLETSRTVFAMFGRERNGVFFR